VLLQLICCNSLRYVDRCMGYISAADYDSQSSHLPDRLKCGMKIVTVQLLSGHFSVLVV